MSGHKTRNVFERYNVVSDDDLRAAVERIEEGRKSELSEPEEGESREQNR
ncbi:MAG: hypothetical protein GY762_07715 [Proteobacteria bacterium]|nr:hypothetical protein [Pseudomonadota bacterium]